MPSKRSGLSDLVPDCVELLGKAYKMGLQDGSINTIKTLQEFVLCKVVEGKSSEEILDMLRNAMHVSITGDLPADVKHTSPQP